MLSTRLAYILLDVTWLVVMKMESWRYSI